MVSSKVGEIYPPQMTPAKMLSFGLGGSLLSTKLIDSVNHRMLVWTKSWAMNSSSELKLAQGQV